MLDNNPVWKAELERRCVAEEFADEEIRRRQMTRLGGVFGQVAFLKSPNSAESRIRHLVTRITADAAKLAKFRECSVLGCLVAHV